MLHELSAGSKVSVSLSKPPLSAQFEELNITTQTDYEPQTRVHQVSVVKPSYGRISGQIEESVIEIIDNTDSARNSNSGNVSRVQMLQKRFEDDNQDKYKKSDYNSHLDVEIKIQTKPQPPQNQYSSSSLNQYSSSSLNQSDGSLAGAGGMRVKPPPASWVPPSGGGSVGIVSSNTGPGGAAAEVTVKSGLNSGREKIITFEGNSALINDVISHLASTRNYRQSSGNTLLNVNGETLQTLYKYLLQQMHDCKIGKVKWNERVGPMFKKIEEIYIWS